MAVSGSQPVRIPEHPSRLRREERKKKGGLRVSSFLNRWQSTLNCLHVSLPTQMRQLITLRNLFVTAQGTAVLRMKRTSCSLQPLSRPYASLVIIFETLVLDDSWKPSQSLFAVTRRRGLPLMAALCVVFEN